MKQSLNVELCHGFGSFDCIAYHLVISELASVSFNMIHPFSMIITRTLWNQPSYPSTKFDAQNAVTKNHVSYVDLHYFSESGFSDLYI